MCLYAQILGELDLKLNLWFKFLKINIIKMADIVADKIKLDSLELEKSKL